MPIQSTPANSSSLPNVAETGDGVDSRAAFGFLLEAELEVAADLPANQTAAADTSGESEADSSLLPLSAASRASAPTIALDPGPVPFLSAGSSALNRDPAVTAKSAVTAGASRSALLETDFGAPVTLSGEGSPSPDDLTSGETRVTADSVQNGPSLAWMAGHLNPVVEAPNSDRPSAAPATDLTDAVEAAPPHSESTSSGTSQPIAFNPQASGPEAAALEFEIPVPDGDGLNHASGRPSEQPTQPTAEDTLAQGLSRARSAAEPGSLAGPPQPHRDSLSSNQALVEDGRFHATESVDDVSEFPSRVDRSAPIPVPARPGLEESSGTVGPADPALDAPSSMSEIGNDDADAATAGPDSGIDVHIQADSPSVVQQPVSATTAGSDAGRHVPVQEAPMEVRVTESLASQTHSTFRRDALAAMDSAEAPADAPRMGAADLRQVEGGDELRIRLSSDQLGRLELRASSTERGGIEATIGADRPEVQQLLRNELPALERTLDQRDLPIEELSVSSGLEQKSSGEGQSSPRRPGAHTLIPDESAETTDDSVDSNGFAGDGVQSTRKDGRLDLHV